MGKYNKKMSVAQPSNQEFFAQANQKVEDTKDVTKDEKKEFVKSLASSKDVQREYAEELIPKVDLNVWAMMVASEFFNAGTVSIGDPMWYQLDYEVDPSMPIYYLSQHGGTPSETFVTDGETVRIHPYFIQTPEVHMNKFSLKQGDITNEQKMRRRMERNMSKFIDKDMWSLLKEGLVGSSETLEDVIGIELDEDYKNFPETNNIDASGEGELSLEIFKKIADHFNRVGRQINNIYIPSNRLSDIYDWVSIPAGYADGPHDSDEVVPSYLQEQIVRSGQLNAVFGYPVNLVPVNILDGTEGNDDGEIEMWISTTSPAGEYRDVRELDDVFMEEDASRIYATMTKGIAMFQAPFQKMNYLRVVFDEFSE